MFCEHSRIEDRTQPTTPMGEVGWLVNWIEIAEARRSARFSQRPIVTAICLCVKQHATLMAVDFPLILKTERPLGHPYLT